MHFPDPFRHSSAQPPVLSTSSVPPPFTSFVIFLSLHPTSLSLHPLARCPSPRLSVNFPAPWAPNPLDGQGVRARTHVSHGRVLPRGLFRQPLIALVWVESAAPRGAWRGGAGGPGPWPSVRSGQRAERTCGPGSITWASSLHLLSSTPPSPADIPKVAAPQSWGPAGRDGDSHACGKFQLSSTGGHPESPTEGWRRSGGGGEGTLLQERTGSNKAALAPRRPSQLRDTLTLRALAPSVLGLSTLSPQSLWSSETLFPLTSSLLPIWGGGMWYWFYVLPPSASGCATSSPVQAPCGQRRDSQCYVPSTPPSSRARGPVCAHSWALWPLSHLPAL